MLGIYDFLANLCVLKVLYFLLFYYFVYERHNSLRTNKAVSFIGSTAGSIILDNVISTMVIATPAMISSLFMNDKFIAIVIVFIASFFISKLNKFFVYIYIFLSIPILILSSFRLDFIILVIALIAFILFSELKNIKLNFSRIVGLIMLAFGCEVVINPLDFTSMIVGIVFIVSGLHTIVKGSFAGRKIHKGFRQDDSDAAAQEAGRKGEERVSDVIKELLGYTILDAKTFGKEHIFIRNDNGNYNEIDHLVIGSNGIFHIETKSYSGTITILENGNWIRVKRNTNEVEELRNPCEQILIHEGVLKGVLGRKYSNYLQSIICFGNEHRDNYSISGKENSQFDIIFHQDLNDYIKDYDNKLQPPLSNDEMQDIVKRIRDHMSFEKP